MDSLEEYRCCECKHLVDWELDDAGDRSTCGECSHEICDQCGQWVDCCQSTSLTKTCGGTCLPDCSSCKLYDPEDDVAFESESDSDDDSDDESYYYKDTEGKKHASIPLNKLLELGPKNDNIIMLAAISQSQSGARQMSVELRMMVYKFHLARYLTEQRTIRAIPRDSENWTYRSFTSLNQVPLFVHGLGGMMKSHALEHLKSAPKLGSNLPYPYFNYGIDLLFLDYPSCGSTEIAFREYVDAMRNAAKYLRAHNRQYPSRIINRIKVTWCNHAEFPYHILDSFRGIPGLDHIVLQAHEHCGHIHEDYRVGDPKFQKDLRDMHFAVRMGYLKGSDDAQVRFQLYDFSAKLYDSNGNEIDGSLKEESEGDGSESSDHETPDTSFESAIAAAEAAAEAEAESESNDDADDAEDE